MASRELYNHVLEATSLTPAARSANTAVNGTGVDLLGFESALILVTAGVITDGTHTIKLQESADNSTFTDVAAGDQLGTPPGPLTSGVGGSASACWAYVGSKRYIRVVATTAGATTGGVFAASVLRGHARHGGTR